MTYNISIDIPKDIIYEQEQKAFRATDGNLNFSDVLTTAVETAMHNLTGNVVKVRLNTVTD